MPELQEACVRCQVLCECKEFQGRGLYLHSYFVTGESMTQDEVIDMARQVIDLNTDKRGRNTFLCDEYGLEAFAKLVAQHEREACAKECEHTALRMGSEWMAQHCAQAIRARGDNK